MTKYHYQNPNDKRHNTINYNQQHFEKNDNKLNYAHDGYFSELDILYLDLKA